MDLLAKLTAIDPKRTLVFRMRSLLKTHHLLSIALLFAIPQIANASSKELNTRVLAFIESAVILYRTESETIERINKTRSGAEVEMYPLAQEMFSDVVFLLENAIHLDKNNFQANYLLGKVYYQQRDGAYEINPSAVLNAKKYLYIAIDLCGKNKGQCTQNTKKELEEMIKVIDWKASYIGKKE